MYFDIFMLPSSEVIIEGVSSILKTFDDVIEMGILKARWEEIKRLQSNSSYAITT